MNTPNPHLGLDSDTADEYASWFACLADGTRVKILSIIASAGRPMTVGEIVEVTGRSQSTVSNHIKRLADERFVITETHGVRTLVSPNPLCMTDLPRAAAAIMNSSGQ
ncbi:MAG: winged helix-turn-helix transcriptional regulator [Actinomycetia bacterium]|nr:winged helix-turn-helix transcriptional regulator [Actinomycetes bacterium]MCP4958020.1 winged helix-turn-helix transcriptional regulator [Actinomycetes bacterium]